MKSERKERFTPGPWSACDLGEDNGGEKWEKWSIIHNGPLAYGGENTNGLENSHANAALIAAAPDMYEALKKVLGMVSHATSLLVTEAKRDEMLKEVVDIAVASLKNARGDHD
jgi:hypothetical protein